MTDNTTSQDIDDLIEGYDDMSVREVRQALEEGEFSAEDRQRIAEYETNNRGRVTLLRNDALAEHRPDQQTAHERAVQEQTGDEPASSDVAETGAEARAEDPQAQEPAQEQSQAQAESEPTAADQPDQTAADQTAQQPQGQGQADQQPQGQAAQQDQGQQQAQDQTAQQQDDIPADEVDPGARDYDQQEAQPAAEGQGETVVDETQPTGRDASVEGQDIAGEDESVDAGADAAQQDQTAQQQPQDQQQPQGQASQQDQTAQQQPQGQGQADQQGQAQDQTAQQQTDAQAEGATTAAGDAAAGETEVDPDAESDVVTAGPEEENQVYETPAESEFETEATITPDETLDEEPDRVTIRAEQQGVGGYWFDNAGVKTVRWNARIRRAIENGHALPLRYYFERGEDDLVAVEVDHSVQPEDARGGSTEPLTRGQNQNRNR